jgi:predicted alpha-1,2-mannosidase
MKGILVTDYTPSGVLAHVDPFIGVNWPGNGLCGPHLPHSLVRLGPDTAQPHDTTGYRSDQPIVCFSHTHVSGTGGHGRYGNIGVTPFLGHPMNPPPAYQRRDETAAAGFYGVVLEPSGIKVELTSTPRVGVHRYTFPAGAEANVLIDAGAVIQVPGLRPGRGTGGSIGGFVEFISERELIGRGDYRGGWGHEFPYSVFFYARFDRPATERWAGNHVGVGPGLAADGSGSKGVARFGKAAGSVGLVVGISLVSVAKARASVEREIAGRDFAAVRAQSEKIWEKSLSRLRVTGGSPTQRKLFYTLFSRLICMPTDLGVDDENPLWHSGVRQFSEFYCLWDSVRNANSFIGLFDPELEAAMLNCLLDIADHIGWVPDAWITGHSSFIQGGSSADVLFAEAAQKGLTGIDYAKALAFMRKGAENESPDPRCQGRYLKDYRDLGYLSTNVPQGSSRHIEYAYQDWCIGALAAKLGQADVAEQYYQSSRQVWNLWRDEVKSIAPRKPDGSWVTDFDPTYLRPDCWNDPSFYEGSGFSWSFSIQHDLAGLIARHGGPAAFVKHLDAFFERGTGPWKEIILHTPYLYTYAGRPDRTAERVREQLRKHYRAERDGLDDNEDMGCQSAFYMCSALGLYPIMGQDLYLLSTPIFEKAEIDLGASGKTLVIEAPGAGDDRPYIVGATIDGKPLDRAWVRHGEIAHGAVIRLRLAAKPEGWGVGKLPPSPLG